MSKVKIPWILPKVPQVDCKAYSVPEGCQDQTLPAGIAESNSPNGEAEARKAEILDPRKDGVQGAFQIRAVNFQQSKVTHILKRTRVNNKAQTRCFQ